MILVLSTYRTGSTELCKNVAVDNNYENLDEVFHESAPASHRNALMHIAKNHDCVVKLFPYHLDKTPVTGLLPHLLEMADRVITLVRNDFHAQCKSYYVCKQVKDWHSNFAEPVRVELDQSTWLTRANFLEQQYHALHKLCNQIDNYELMFTEDLQFSTKYNRPVIWDTEPGLLEFNVQELFT